MDERDTSPVEPMWEPSGSGAPRGLAGRAMAAAGAVARRLAPHLFRWAAAQKPELRLAWGSKEFHVRRDGVVEQVRDGPGWEGNPRRNYSEAVKKRQERTARDPERPGTQNPQLQPAAAAPAVDLSAGALERDVKRRMGITQGDSGAGPREPEALKSELSRMRELLQSLDDVKDYALVESADEELYLLHKAVEYKLKSHKASEAKARLGDLFAKKP
jgi:hypothetical protein